MTRVEEASRRGLDDRARARRRASACAPTTRCVEAEEPERAACGARRSRSRRSSGILRRVDAPRSSSRPTPTAARSVALDARPAAARLGALRPVPAARRRAGGRSTAALEGLASCSGTSADALVGLGRGRARRPAVPTPPRTLLRDELGADPACAEPPVPFEQVSLPEPALPAAAARAAGGGVGAEHVRDDREARVAHAVGRSLSRPGADPLRRRLERARTPWCCPARPSRCAARAGGVRRARAWRWCPFGGGTSVVGGVEPVREGFAGGDLARPAPARPRPWRWTATSLTARRWRPGCSAPSSSGGWREEGVTLGHFPQSFEYSTVGGWVATRSAGQASTGYGRIDELVEGVRCVDARGRAGHAGRAGVGGRAEPARAGGGLRGRAGRDLRGDAARAARAGARAATRAGRSASFAEGCDALAGDGAGGRRAGREPALRRGRDAAHDGARVVRQHAREKLGPRATCACAGTRAAASRSSGFEGDEEDGGAAAAGTPPGCCGPGEGWRSATGPGEAWHARPLRRARTCATTCSTAACWWTRSRPPPPGEPARSSTRPCGGACARAGGPRHAAARHVPRLAPVSAPAPRSTSPSWPARRTTPLAQWRAAKTAASRGDRRPTAARSPTTTRSAATTALAGGRGRRARHRGAARRQAAARPRRDHEPREAAARLSAARPAGCRTVWPMAAVLPGLRGRLLQDRHLAAQDRVARVLHGRRCRRSAGARCR